MFDRVLNTPLVEETDNDLNSFIRIFSFIPIQPRTLQSIEINKSISVKCVEGIVSLPTATFTCMLVATMDTQQTGQCIQEWTN